MGKRARLNVYGGDYPTPDGTGVRDYIHVVDLALGHLKALEYLGARPVRMPSTWGPAAATASSEVIAAFEQASGRKLPYAIVERRPGDVPISFANSEKAAKELGWGADKDIARMCADAWRWQLQRS
ncbi:MAG: GDP-mannose 4,6-dehydratase [Caldilineaceae bacterium]